jgi:hypothetical protein
MKYGIKILTESKTIQVTLTAYIEKDEGIGGYEYWGFREYDSGSGELFVSELDWDKEKYSEEENELIAKYIDENSENIEHKIIKLCKMY